MADALRLLGGAADIVIQAAGVYALAPALRVDQEDWDVNQDINLRASFFVAQAAVAGRDELGPSRDDGDRQHLLGRRPFAREPATLRCLIAPARPACSALTRGMAAEWARKGVRVNVVAPGVIDTSMLRIMDNPEAGKAWLDCPRAARPPRPA